MANMSDKDLAARVEAKYEPIHLSGKAEIWDYFLDKHGQNKKAAASDAARMLSGESSGKAYHNARRNFEGSRTEAKKGETAKWKDFGKKLPPKGFKPPKKVKITFTGRVKVSEGRKNKKGKLRGDGWTRAHFSKTFQGSDVLDPTFNSLFSDYFDNFERNPVTDFEATSIGVEVE